MQICAGLHLKVFGNSTRPAPARVRLGYQRRPTPLCVPLSSLHPQGGLVGCLDIVVVRKYPLMVSSVTFMILIDDGSRRLLTQMRLPGAAEGFFIWSCLSVQTLLQYL